MKKYFWQIITVILALVAIFATYNVFFLSKPTKDIRIIVDSDSPLISIRSEANGNIQITYNGQIVSNVQLVQIRIQNSGNQPIQINDYVRPISFSFDPKDEILDASIINSQPSDIGLSISKISSYQVSTSPVLLNSGDVVTIRFIVIESGTDSFINHFHVDGRIVGVNEITVISLFDAQTQYNNLFNVINLASQVASVVFFILVIIISIRASIQRK